MKSPFSTRRGHLRHLLASFALLSSCVLPAGAFAVRESRPILIDQRVRTIMYQPDAVFKFTGHFGFQSAIEFASGESISTISMGDATGWMLNPLDNMLFLKPVSQNATTNMTLITNERVYLFELHAREASGIDDPEMTFIMRFIYPGQDATNTVSQYTDSVPIPDLERDAGLYNFNYSIAGPEEIAPLRIFDDGEFTYFEFRGKNADVPAFYSVDKNGKESMINYRARGTYIVVERVSEKMTLRYGDQVVCVFNEAWDPTRLTAAPKISK